MLLLILRTTFKTLFSIVEIVCLRGLRMKVIWAEKYRPQTIEDFVGQSSIREEMQAIIEGKSPMQHFLFYSHEPGTGKTSMAYLLANALGYQIMKFNASSKKQRGIEFVEEDLMPMARSGQREVIILLDEADQLTPAAQSALKGVIEDSTVYFILTCNDISKVSTWLQSRCQLKVFQPHTDEDVLKRLATISAKESVEVKEFVLKRIVDKHKGDMRNCIGALQSYAHLPAEAKEQFVNSLSVPDIDSRLILKLCFVDKDIDLAYENIYGGNVRQKIRAVFRYAVDNSGKPENKLRVIDAAVQSERDLINGVDEQIVLYNFLRMMIEG